MLRDFADCTVRLPDCGWAIYGMSACQRVACPPVRLSACPLLYFTVRWLQKPGQKPPPTDKEHTGADTNSRLEGNPAVCVSGAVVVVRIY